MSRDLYSRMTEALEAAGYDTSLSAVARLFDVWPSAVSKWRDGESLPELKKLLELVEITGCSADWLFSGEGERVRDKSVDDITKELLKRWAELPEQDRRAVLDFVLFKSQQPPPPEPKK